MTNRHLIPSADDAALDYEGAREMDAIWASFCGCRDRCHQCSPCCWSAGRVSSAALALDNALSVGRRFDRDRQQAIWQQREDAALLKSVAW